MVWTADPVSSRMYVQKLTSCAVHTYVQLVMFLTVVIWIIISLNFALLSVWLCQASDCHPLWSVWICPVSDCHPLWSVWICPVSDCHPLWSVWLSPVSVCQPLWSVWLSLVSDCQPAWQLMLPLIVWDEDCWSLSVMSIGCSYSDYQVLYLIDVGGLTML